MNQDNMFVTMIANHSVAVRRFTITLSILLILIVIAFGVNIWLLWHTVFMVSGGQIAPSIKLPAQACLPSDAQERLRLITERPKDYLRCLTKETN